ncbi:MAG: hypothetical protein ACLQVI_17860, partial [Polyangiaceae bacterium]
DNRHGLFLGGGTPRVDEEISPVDRGGIGETFKLVAEIPQVALNFSASILYGVEITWTISSFRSPRG